jgi:nicotinate phosphoribosyltransferase
VYKLVEQQTPQGVVGRFKLSKEKRTYPFAKQVFRQSDRDGMFTHDIVGRADESLPGEALLIPIMRGGRLIDALPSLVESRSRCLVQVARLPAALKSLEAVAAAYPVQISARLEREAQQLASEAVSK